ncbi:hypothetical protein [Legionella shakespearei]|uniref:Phospholipase C n=1 Tax=Legionella shakespearei DSM 23087 TaxID=1122169 RepID=A0A0W0YVV2_9GAMM|nr:hypothetical protein [Legionella shakespearei]KTD60978.1 phospholipase C [Legionella shakespearei DSM 23087]
MLKNITQALPLSLFVALHCHAHSSSSSIAFKAETTTQLMEKYGPGFSSLEHKNIGDNVKLHLSGTDSANELVKLTLPNGLKLSYGEIVMYGGDMFGDASHPISNCKPADQANCFKAQFDALGVKGEANNKRCSNPLNQAKTLDKYMGSVEKDLEIARSEGVNDWDFYDKHDVTITKELNKLTCGGSVISAFIPFGSYIKLAQANFDHFAPDSLTAYRTGHRYAMETAREGFTKMQAGDQQEANRLLELAYAQNAFANHYLTDSFSAGHMRTPRRAIAKGVFLPAALNLLIANLMHNEDNRHGLNVVNAEGTSWVAYGDGYLYKPEAEMQRLVMLDAMQRSADGVYNAFLTGQIPDKFPEMDLLPDYSKIPEMNDTAPLFKVENGVVLKRVKNNDYYDHHWTKYWSGLITLIRFQVSN